MKGKCAKTCICHFFVVPSTNYPKGAPRKYVRTFVQTTTFLAQNYACTSTDDIFLLKSLQI